MTADPLPNAADAEHLTEALRRSGSLGEASVCNVAVMASEPRKSGSHETRRWREMDSNPRSPQTTAFFETAPKPGDNKPTR
jgi:hypothetical protein